MEYNYINKENVIGFFGEKNKNGFFSQFYKAEFIFEDEKYICAEQFFMSQKAKCFDDMEINKLIMAETDPKIMKKLGRMVKNFNPKKWDDIKYQIAVRGNTLKFSQNPDLLNKLLATGDKYLAECSPYDSIWGVGTRSQDPAKWNGENLLGKALMEVRFRLRELNDNKKLS